MKPLILLAAALSVALAGCQKQDEEPASPAYRFGIGSQKGRYLGLGLYRAERMWTQLNRPADPKTPVDPAAATLKDDEVVLVVVDSATGEIRQCGALSGYCVRMDPWTQVVSPAPAALIKHAEQLDEEARAEMERREAAAKPAPRRSSSPTG